MTVHLGARATLALLSAVALVASCHNGNDRAAPPASTSTTTSIALTTTSTTAASTTTLPAVEAKSWTVLVYSIADTDLEPFLISDVGEMGAVGTTDALNIFALVDRSDSYSDEPVLGLPDWTGGKLLQVGQGTATVVEDLGDVDTGDPAVLADFIATGIELNPAQHYALIISDHGASWPGVGDDGSAGGNVLTLAEMHSAIADGLERAGVAQLDLLGFDACLMATYEVASELAPVARRMIASQELEPGHGWDYRSLALLAERPDTDVDELGREILNGFRDQAKAEGTADSITLHLLDLTMMPALDSAMASFATAIDERVAAVAPVLGATRADTLEFGRSPDPVESTHMADLGQLVAAIGVEALDLAPQADQVTRALNDVVLASVKGRSTLGATGLSIYFPETEEFLSAEYANVVDNSKWSEMLVGYYRVGSEIPADSQPRFATSGDEGTVVELSDEGVTISAALDPATVTNIAYTTVSYGVILPDGSITYLGDERTTGSDTADGTATGFYDLTILRMSDGLDEVEAYVSIVWDHEAGVATISVPMAYYSPEDVSGETYQDVLLLITVETDTFKIIDETYYAYNETLGGYGELSTDPTGIIVPEQYTRTPDGSGTWDATSDIGLYADLDDIELTFVPLESGLNLWLELTVTDFGGNTATATAQITTP